MSARDYPASRREEIVEMLHGVEVRDAYRWLEDGESDAVRTWTEAENALTVAKLAAYPGRERLRERLTELLSIGTITAPAVRKGRLFYLRREGGPKQPGVLWGG